MHLPLRQQLTTGVALVGAAVIVVSPIAPPPPDIQIAAPAATTANVELAATWAQLLFDSATNLGILFDQASFEYVVEGDTLPPEPDTEITFSPVLQQIFFNTNDSIQGVINAIIGQGGGQYLPDLIEAVVTVIAKPIQNSLAVAGLVLNDEAIGLLAIGLAGPLLSTVFATGEAIENVLDPNTPEDFVPALINFIPTIADGLLNGGYGEVPGFLRPSAIPPGVTVRPGGLLNGSEPVPSTPPAVILPGLASTLLTARDQIAITLGAVPAPPATVTTFTGGDEKLAGTEITNGTLDDPVTPVKERKGPVKRILESFKAIPSGNADVGVRASSERPRPVLGAVKTVTKTINAVRNEVRDALGLPPRPDHVKAEPVKADAPE